MARAHSEDGEDRCPWHDTLIEAMGKDGKRGRLGNLENKVKEQDAELKTVKAVQIRLIIYTALAAVGGSSAASFAFKLLASP